MTRSLSSWTGNAPSLFDDFGKEMNRLMERFFDGEPGGSRAFAPQLNVAETDNAYEVSVDLPGMKPEDVNIEFKDGQLWITGERKEEKEERERMYHRVERRVGHFRRVITLGADVDVEKVEAHYKDGVLSVSVPKAPSAQPKRITVKG